MGTRGKINGTGAKRGQGRQCLDMSEKSCSNSHHRQCRHGQKHDIPRLSEAVDFRIRR